MASITQPWPMEAHLCPDLLRFSPNAPSLFCALRAHVVASLLGEAGVPIRAQWRLQPSSSSLFDEVLPSEAASLIFLYGVGSHWRSLPGSGLNLSRSSTPVVAKIPSPLCLQALDSGRGLDPCTSTSMMDFARSGRRGATHGELRLSLPDFPLF
ncbi:hypothetical protein PR202_ga13788 [Eleusine coracana subsp. coracana]|uniref:Uncharacterized protein n=1 Tax=Eleusine coracana subsp. coracana TaxID=191504 RepID=A0AAV5CFN4_ELECO|nr:hypothetical protein PR202_ga13788 [Eleusine coracana subsp. coracana]